MQIVLLKTNKFTRCFEGSSCDEVSAMLCVVERELKINQSWQTKKLPRPFSHGGKNKKLVSWV